MTRLVVFTDPEHVAARVLLPALRDALRGRQDIACAGIIAPRREAHWRRRLRWRWQRTQRRLQAMVGSGRWERALDLGPCAVESVARGLGGQVIRCASEDPNEAAVLDWLDEAAPGALALNLFFVRPFRRELRARFESVLNYHNGRLPAYRGLRASNWSIYAGGNESGFAFHWMDDGIDSGPVLCSGTVALVPDDTPADVELRKARAAAAMLPRVLDALCRREPGQAQAGLACTHNRCAFELATRVDDPSRLTRAEWERRLRAFLRVHARIDGRWWAVTRVVACAAGARRSFQTADGHWLQVGCADFWPAALVPGCSGNA